MHMADALLSPAVGGATWVAGAAALAWSARRVQCTADERLVPLMGVLGAFVFAAQMINVALPGTGCSTHLGGGLLLAALLGPHAALIVMASVLAVQALFFADGGLLAYGANLLNIGVWPCLVAYPFVYRPLAGRSRSPARVAAASLAAGVVALLGGAAGVVLQVAASGVSALPAEAFAAIMLPVHALVGVGEGLASAALLLFVARHRPDLLQRSATPHRPLRPVLTATAAAALLTGGVFSGFASSAPDGLEWSVARTAGVAGLPRPEGALHARLEALQARLSLLPPEAAGEPPPGHDATGALAAVVGAAATLAAVSLLGWWLRRREAPRRAA
jgi:cobalt/nickel transport system permease protein